MHAVLLHGMKAELHVLKGLVSQDGMQVTFSEIIGMEDLNDGKPRKVKNCKVCFSLHPSCAATCHYKPSSGECTAFVTCTAAVQPCIFSESMHVHALALLPLKYGPADAQNCSIGHI